MQRATTDRGLAGPIHQMTLVSPLEFAHETGETVTRVLIGVVPGLELTWGDLDCDGTVAIGDALKTARYLIGLSVR